MTQPPPRFKRLSVFSVAEPNLAEGQQRIGAYGLILLHLLKPDEDDEEEERDLGRSGSPRFRR
jgi:hypothetical protein